MFSVAITTYNGESFINQCIDSVLNQDGGFDFEIVVSDNGSQDKTVSLVKHYPDDRVRLIFNEPPGFAYSNFTNASRATKYPLVVMLNQDDLLAPRYFSLMAEFFERHPTMGTANLTSISIDESGTPNLSKLDLKGDESFQDYLDREPSSFGEKCFPPGKEYCKELSQFHGAPWAISGSCSRKTIMEELDYFHPEYFHMGDLDFLVRLASRYSVGYWGAPGVLIRNHAGQLSWENHRTGRVLSERMLFVNRMKDEHCIDEVQHAKLVNSIKRCAAMAIPRSIAKFQLEKTSTLIKLVLGKY